MEPIVTCRCPSCDALNTLDQSICRRCLGPLLPSASTRQGLPMTGETCSIYRARATDARLLLSRSLVEYTASGIALATIWNNVASITQTADDDQLHLYQTPQQIKMPLGSGRVWFSDVTRTIPLRQFGYPNNQQLSFDIGRYAPHLHLYLHATAAPRD
jgi:hypothetical protein